MATFPPYGYKKQPSNHNQLIIDEEAAVIVKYIFQEYSECGVKADVVRSLNARNILTPQEYISRE